MYHMKRVLHDWSDDRCQRILKNTVTAMDRDRSILLIMEAVGALPINCIDIIDTKQDEFCRFCPCEMLRFHKQWVIIPC